MNDHLSCHQNDIVLPSIATQLELTDFDADRRLLDLPGASLVIFTSQGCASCRYARQQLPGMGLPVQRLVWIDAQQSSGLVQRYEVFQLPALFVVCEGEFFGALHVRLSAAELRLALLQALARAPDDLP